jgi:hypothetical protein
MDHHRQTSFRAVHKDRLGSALDVQGTVQKLSKRFPFYIPTLLKLVRDLGTTE